MVKVEIYPMVNFPVLSLLLVVGSSCSGTNSSSRTNSSRGGSNSRSRDIRRKISCGKGRRKSGSSVK